MKLYPPIGLCCNATQSIWDNVVTSNTPNESVHEENFRFVCPCCGQHLDCEPAYEGVACMCPICSNTIYPQRPIEFITPQTDNYQSAQHTSDFFMEYDDDDEIDWEGITDDMRSDMEVELDSIEYCYIDDMPPKAVEEFENAAEIAWTTFSSSSSFRKKFREWCKDNDFEMNDEYAKEYMKEEWIDEWKADNEYDWCENWSSEHKGYLHKIWNNTKKIDWQKNWAYINAVNYDITPEKLLTYWGIR